MWPGSTSPVKRASPQPKAFDGIPGRTLREGFGQQGNPRMSRGQGQCGLVDSTRGEQDGHLWAQGTQVNKPFSHRQLRDALGQALTTRS